MKKGLLRTFLAASLLLVTYSIGQSNSSGSPGDYSGSSSNCSSCHTGNSVNTSSKGSIKIDFTDAGGTAVTKIKASTTYNVKVTLTGGSSTYGFCFSVKDGTSRVGTYSGLGTAVKSATSYVTHSSSSNSGSFGFKWTSPSTSLSAPKLFAAGNVADGSGGDDGDYIFTTNQSLSFVGIEDQTFVKDNFKIFAKGNNELTINKLNINSFNFQIVDLNGKTIQSSYNQSSNIVLNNIPSGIVLVKLTDVVTGTEGVQKVLVY